MATQTTFGITVSIESTYLADQSNPEKFHYMFSYRIKIQNDSPNTVKLVRRHWDIFDSIGLHKQVDGEGVVGQQPVIKPGGYHVYTSGCNLSSEIGYMEGKYEMFDLTKRDVFNVVIPRFQLIASYKLN